MSLENIEKELYGQKTSKTSSERTATKNNERVPAQDQDKPMATNPWRDEQIGRATPERVKKIEKMGPRLFAGLTAVLIILIGFAGYYLYQYFTTKDARFDISAPTEVKIGEPFDISVVFENISKKTLYEPVFSLQLPDGAVYVENPSRRIIEESIADAQPGDSIRRDFTIVLTGTSYQAYRFNADASFRYGESTLSSKFQKNANTSVVARNPVVSLDIVVPESVINGQDFELQVRYKNETDAVLKNILIRMDLPKDFSLNNSDPKLEEGKMVRIDELGAYEEGIIIVSGFLTGNADAYVPFGSRAVISLKEKEYEVASKSNSISVASSPLEVVVSSDALTQGDQSAGYTYPGEKIEFKTRIKNNSSVPLREVVANIKFEGAHFNLATVQGDGSLHDADRTYTWNAGRVPALGQLNPGQSVDLPLSVSLIAGYAPQGIALKNSELKVIATAESTTVPPELTAQKTIGMHVYTLKMGGKAEVEQLLFYAEPNTEMQNTGPIPPQVGKETTFTVHWRLVARGSDMQDARLRGSLGDGMQWTGKVITQNTKQVPQYNSQTGEIVWNVDEIEVGAPIPEAFFQITFTPASNMAGRQYVFLEHISFEARDAFVGNNLSLEPETIDSRDFADANSLQMGYDKVKP